MTNFESLGGSEFSEALNLEIALYIANLRLAVGVTEAEQDKSVYNATKGLVNHCYNEQVDDVVFVDRKARSVWPGFTEYWRLAYPEQDRPDIHFLNPRATSNPYPSRFLGSIIDKLIAYNTKKQMEATKSSLYANKEKKVLLFDVCAHTGANMDGLERTLARVGFSNVETAVFLDATEGRHDFDFVFTTDNRQIPCSPMRCDEGLEKPQGAIYVNGSTADPRHLAGHRVAMRDLILNNFDAENKSPD